MAELVGSYMGSYGTNNGADLSPSDIPQRMAILKYLTSSTNRVSWAKDMGFLAETELSVKYNKNYLITEYGYEYYKDTDMGSL